jgi:subtilase family protein/Big-like domain-containing protein
MNVSFGSVASFQTISSAAQYVRSKGGIVVASAGNCSCNDPTPENPYIISVGATDAVDAVKSFSSRGAYVDLAAPGVMIKTTAREGDYVYIAGTSFSSPIVAGVVALMMAANPSATPAEIEGWLKQTALDIDAAGYDTASGAGRVRADLAVAAAASAASAPSPADVTPPAASIGSPAEGATVSGIANVAVAASDDHAVASVDLYADGVLVGHAGVAPFAFAWDSRTVADGAHALVAVAADAAGNAGSSSPVDVVTDNSVDQAPPTAAVTSPANGSTVSRTTVTVQAQAQDDAALARLDVLVDGKPIGGVDCAGVACSVSVRWNAKKASRGLHEIRATAIDQVGNRATSAPVTVTVR